MTEVIVFSKNRACQLELLLRSLVRHTDLEPQRVAVLFRATDDWMAEGYARLRAKYTQVRWVAEQNFATDVRRLATGLAAPTTIMLVDDNAFVRPFLASGPEVAHVIADPDVLCLSLRMNPRVDHRFCGLDPCEPPVLTNGAWAWRGLPHDWGYPMSLDGHVFKTEDIRPLLREADAAYPNLLELYLVARPPKRPLMTCFEESRIINNCANMVQAGYRRPQAGQTATWLNAEFLAGRRIALEPLEALDVRAAHVLVPYVMEPAQSPVTTIALPQILCR